MLENILRDCYKNKSFIALKSLREGVRVDFWQYPMIHSLGKDSVLRAQTRTDSRKG